MKFRLHALAYVKEKKQTHFTARAAEPKKVLGAGLYTNNISAVLRDSVLGGSGDMHFRCLSAKHVLFTLHLYRDGSTLASFKVAGALHRRT